MRPQSVLFACVVGVVSLGISVDAAAGAGDRDGALQPNEAHDGTPEPTRYRIAWDWPDEAVTYDLVRTTVDTIPVPGKDPVVEQTIARRVSHRRGGTPGNGGEAGPGTDAVPVRVTWETIRFDRNDSLNTPLVYDSTIEGHWTRARHPLIGGVAASLGQSVVFDIAPDGSVVSVREIEAFLRGIERNLTRWNLADERTYERLQAAYTPRALAQSADGTYAFLPDRPLAVGESYTVERPITFEHVRTLVTEEIHTLEAIDEEDDGARVARFGIGGTVRWPDPGGARGQMFNVSLDKVSLGGAWSFDLDRGVVRSYVLRVGFLSDIVRFDPRDGSSTETSTDQKLTDRMTLVKTPDPDRAPKSGYPEP